MTPWERMRAHLAQETEALRAGRLAALAALAEEKARLTARLDGPPPPDLAAEIRTLAEGNARLLAAAAQGVRAALLQVREARRAGSTRTYDRAGRRETLGTPDRSLERRA